MTCCGCGCASRLRARAMSTRVPVPGSLCIAMVPSTSQRIERQIDRPRPLPCGLVVKNGSSHPRQMLLRNAASGVGDGRSRRRARSMRGLNRDAPAVRHRLARVGEQVEKHLLEIALAAGDRRKVVGHVDRAARCRSGPFRTSGLPTPCRWRAAPGRARFAVPHRAKTTASRRKSGGTPGATSAAARGPPTARPARALPPRRSSCSCCTSGSIAPSALFTSCDTLRARSAIACLRSAVTHAAAKRLGAMQILNGDGGL